MKLTALTTILLAVFIRLPCAMAYSPFVGLDHCDVAGLAERGISIASWNSPKNIDPPLYWVQVTYDCSKSPVDEDVLMTLWVASSNGQFLCATSAQHTKGGASKLILLFGIREDNLMNSRVDIDLPKRLAEVSHRPYGDPGLAGVYLSVNRIVELTRQIQVNHMPEDTAPKLADPHR